MAVSVESLGRAEKTRLRILEAAEKVFGTVGYHAAGVNDVTTKAGVAAGTFYVHFPSKLAVLTELIETRGHELRTELHEATKGLTKRKEIERAGFETFLSWVRGHPEIYRVVRNAEFVAPEVFRDWYMRLGSGYVRGLRESMDAGEIRRADPEVFAWCLMAIGDFVGMKWVLWKEGSAVPKKVIDEVMDFVALGLGFSEDA